MKRPRIKQQPEPAPRLKATRYTLIRRWGDHEKALVLKWLSANEIVGVDGNRIMRSCVGVYFQKMTHRGIKTCFLARQGSKGLVLEEGADLYLINKPITLK